MVTKAQKYAIQTLAGHSRAMGKSIWAVDCSAFAILRTGLICPPAALQVLESQPDFPRNLRLAGEQISSCHFSSVYEFMT
jgi:hypothetical protein